MPTTSKNSETVVLHSGYRSDRATTTLSYFFAACKICYISCVVRNVIGNRQETL
jgi:hypothetical protein